tara:strand:- start:119 stop:364 length:246 start_codon:yes stop_codon:yes gene_type:complete
MNKSKILIQWPNGHRSYGNKGDDWLELALKAGINIPTGCLGGSCGACEIEVNGEIVRACIHSVKETKDEILKVEFSEDPFW